MTKKSFVDKEKLLFGELLFERNTYDNFLDGGGALSKVYSALFRLPFGS
jgi:hypothetical protein